MKRVNLCICFFFYNVAKCSLKYLLYLTLLNAFFISNDLRAKTTHPQRRAHGT